MTAALPTNSWAAIMSPEAIEEWETREFIEVKSRTVSLINIYFLKAKEDNQLKILLRAPSPISRPQSLKLELIDQLGAVVGSKVVGRNVWGESFREDQLVISIPQSGIAKGTRLEASLESGSVRGFGTKEVPDIFSQPLYSVGDFLLEPVHSQDNGEERLGQGRLSFRFINRSIYPTTITPEWRVKNRSKIEPSLEPRRLPTQTVLAQTDQELVFLLTDLPTSPGVYEVALDLLTENRRRIGGQMRETWLVEGGVGVINFMDLLPASGKDHDYVFRLDGVVDHDQADLRIELEGFMGNQPFNAHGETQARANAFEVSIPLQLGEKAHDVRGIVKLWWEESLLAEKRFNFSTVVQQEIGNVIEPVAEMVPEKTPEVLVENLSREIFYWAWGWWFLSLIFSVASVFLLRLTPRCKNFVWLLCLLGSLWSGQIKAAGSSGLDNRFEGLWFGPGTHWSYNAKATEDFDNFSKIFYHGSIENQLTAKGLFSQDLEELNIVMKQGEETRGWIFEGRELNEKDPKQVVKLIDGAIYRFVTDLADQPKGLLEGDWSIEVSFRVDEFNNPEDSNCSKESYREVYCRDYKISDEKQKIRNDQTPPTVRKWLYDQQEFSTGDERVRPKIKKALGLESSDKEEKLTKKLKKLTDSGDFLADFFQIVAQRKRISKGEPDIPDIPYIPLEADRYNNSGIDFGLMCEDGKTGAGCNPRCNPADSECFFDCEKNLPACQAAEKATGITYPEGELYQVDCSDDSLEEICRSNTLDGIIRGNFCPDPETCDTSDNLHFQLCDNVGNCVSSDGQNDTSSSTPPVVLTDWYDPVKPVINKAKITRFSGQPEKSEGDDTKQSLAADKAFLFEIEVTEKLNVKESDTTEDSFDDNVCGVQPMSDFFRENNDAFCTQAERACIENDSLESRGVKKLNNSSLASCSTVCPIGYVLGGSGLCEIECRHRLLEACFPVTLLKGECTDTDWSPGVLDQPGGKTFTQISNCGNTRQRLGAGSSRYNNAIFDTHKFE